jgi:hypothetical protein
VLDWLFAGLLLLGLWGLAAILDAGVGRRPRHAGGAQAAAPRTPSRPITGGRALGAC